MPHHNIAPLRIACTLVALLAALVGLVPPASADAFPLTITDDAGVATTFAAAPSRIVSLNPGLTEIVFALGAGDRLVAVDRFSNYPAEAQAIQPHLDTYPSPSVETIVALKPDLVLSLADRDDALNQLRQQGIPVLRLVPSTFDQTVTDINRLGDLLGAPSQARTVTDDMLRRRDAVVAAVADAPRPSVYEELDAGDPTRPFAAGPNGFYGELIDLAGGTNIFADLPGDFAQVSAESIIDRNPDVILMTDVDLPESPQTPAMLAARPGWDAITAVQNGAIYPLQGALVSTPGPRLIDGLESIAAVLHPDRFAPPTPEPSAVRVPELAVVGAARR
ncbi:MAG: ABC transporter substrate-binding protein [Chloroflexi bacterium]|nr:ABC transporter substrate-binding protein [Chloroflexota bacterium]